MPASDSGKSRSTGIRLPVDLMVRLEKVKREEAHPRVPNNDLFLEAIALYVRLAEKYGLDDDLRPKCVCEASEKNQDL